MPDRIACVSLSLYVVVPLLQFVVSTELFGVLGHLTSGWDVLLSTYSLDGADQLWRMKYIPTVRSTLPRVYQVALV